MTPLFTNKLVSLPIILVSFLSIACCRAASLSEQPASVEEMSVSLANNTAKEFPKNIVPLSIDGENFVDPTGQRVRFWGMNLTAFYPSHQVAERTAENLASLGINMVRPHHMMRQGLDWNPDMKSGALVDYRNNSRQFDQDALDKFDYLNAALRKQGIYLAFALNWSRSYHQGDVDIIKTTEEDAAAWTNGWKEITSWDWRKQLDVVKSLSLIDERFIAIDEEFATQLLNHVNPYTGQSYAHDPQVATIEVINEYSAEYTFICNNKFPDYFHQKLQKKWNEYSIKNGIEISEFYQPKTVEQRVLRLDFLLSLDAARMNRMIALTRALGFKGAITYSNLFRGENLLSLQEQRADYIEDHVYADPFMVESRDDLFYSKSKSLIQDKPFIISEFNITENDEIRDKQKNKRTMLTAATVAYASLQNWSGITWFAWQHGTKQIGNDGWSRDPDRNPTIGNLAKDEMQLDHFKTAATIFRHGYIQQASPQILTVDSPYKFDDYFKFIAGKYQYQKGWQNVYPIRKTFALATPEALKAQQTAKWMTAQPESPLISATDQIIKDIERKQLTAVAKKAEIFTGYLDSRDPAGLKFMKLNKNQGFATVMLTSNDGLDLINSKNLLISKTFFEEGYSWFGFSRQESESDELPIILKTGNAFSKWAMKITRPVSNQKVINLSANKDGDVLLPEVNWYQSEVTLVE
jgi:hypothetical protein